MSSKVVGTRVSYLDAPLTGIAFASGVAKYSDPIDIRYSDGYAAVLATIAGASPDLDLYIEVSEDKVNWYRPYAADGSAFANIFTTLAADRYQMMTIPIAKWLRFVIDPDADTTVGLQFFNKEFV